MDVPWQPLNIIAHRRRFIFSVNLGAVLGCAALILVMILSIDSTSSHLVQSRPSSSLMRRINVAQIKQPTGHLSQKTLSEPVGHPLPSAAPPAASVPTAPRHGPGIAWATGLLSITAGQPAMASLADFQPILFDGLTDGQRRVVWVIIFGQFVGFLGALVTGTIARQRGEAIKVLAQKLQKVNRQLRQRVRVQREEGYGPGAPEEVVGRDHEAVVLELRRAKQLLKAEDPKAALLTFQRALQLTQAINPSGDGLQVQRKAERGVAAALQELGRLEEALQAMQRVLTLTERIGDTNGLTDAYGVMADLLTDLGRYEAAGKYYDLYLEQMDRDSATGADSML